MKTVVVCEAQVPFIRGGAEALSRELVREFRERGYETELISLPFKWYPKTELLPHAAAWRMLDLSESSGRPIDLLVATKFPTYFARHPRKVCWLVHQHRAAYDLIETQFTDFSHQEADIALRERLITLDTEMLGECRGLFSISSTVSKRVERFNGLKSEPLYHPPRLAKQLRGGPAGSYVLSVGRLESVKRVDLVIKAMLHAPASLNLLIAGTGTHADALKALAESSGLASRVRFLGAVDDEQLIDLYACALAIVFPPLDEDYGYVTLEAFLSHKPVVTTDDAGGPNEFVTNGVNGFMTAADPKALGEAIARLDADRQKSAQMGDEGYDLARGITWSGVIERLTSA